MKMVEKNTKRPRNIIGIMKEDVLWITGQIVRAEDIIWLQAI